jgi:glycerophosphoryl diester phosphodiesterase
MLISLKQGYTGISYKKNIGDPLTKEKIDLMHKKGLKIIVWNLSSNDEITGLRDIGVDYVQMDM